MPDTLYTTADVARLLGLSSRRVRTIAESRGVGRKFGHVLAFTLEDIERMARRVPGRPRKEQGK